MKALFRISALIYLAITITACQTSTTLNTESNTSTLPAAADNGPSQNISRIVSSTLEEDGWQLTTAVRGVLKSGKGALEGSD